MFVGQILAIAGADDLFCGIMAEQPSRKCDACRVRFQGARRQIDDQPFRLTRAAFLERCGQQIDVLARYEVCMRIELIKRALDKRRKIIAQQDPVLFRS